MRVIFPRHDLQALIAKLQSRLPDLNRLLPLRQVILFGSWVAGRATDSSDIDLLVVYDDPEHPEAFKVVRRTLGMAGLEPHIYTASQAHAMASVLDRMTDPGVVLWPQSTLEQP